MRRGAATGLGLLAGGLIGGAARPGVVYAFWAQGATADTLLPVLLVSAGIGTVVGVVAVLVAPLAGRSRSGRVAVGAFSGAALAYLAAVVTFLPLFWGSLLGVNGVRTVDDEAPVYGVTIALAGALSGGCGSLLRSWLAGRSP